MSKRVYETWMKRLPPLDERIRSVTGDSNIPEKVLIPVLNRGVGIEIEIENVKRVAGTKVKGWTLTTDGSLRNNGVEFITNYGSRVHQARGLINDLRAKLNHDIEFSPRTSVHVHLDVRFFPLEQLEALMIVYTIFEDALFNFAGPDRKSNVFCVPFRYTRLPDKMMDGNMMTMLARLREGNKYCAFNLAAIGDKGTVEFRHMSGTIDPDKICCWIMILGLMLQYARRVKLADLHAKVNDMKSSSQYDEFKKDIFYQFSSLLISRPEELDDALTDAKLLFNSFKGA